MTDYFFRVADAAGLPRPPTRSRAEAQRVLSAGMLSFLNDSRRMSNAKLLDELACRCNTRSGRRAAVLFYRLNSATTGVWSEGRSRLRGSLSISQALQLLGQ